MKKVIFDSLISDVIKHGESHQKKHGNWIILRLSNNEVGEYFQLDTWNKSLTLKKGVGTYEYWTGFSGDVVLYLGSDWGRFESDLSSNVLIAFHNRLKNWINYLTSTTNGK